MMNATLRGKPDAGNPHVRFDGGEVASTKPRRGSLLYSARLFLSSVVVAFASVASAADIAFPDADGKGDLASTGSWGTDPIPATTERVLFSWNTLKTEGAYTFTASEDITFAGLSYQMGVNRPLTLDMRNEATGATDAPRKITLTADVVNADNASDNNITIKGGDWTGKSFNQTAWAKGKNTYRFEGARMNLSGSFVGGYGSSGNRFIFDDSCIVTAAMLKAQFNYGGNNQIHVLGGSKIVLTGSDSQFYTGQGDWPTDNDNGIWVSGIGTTVEVARESGTCQIGGCAKAGGHFLKIDEGAKVVVPTLIRLGNANGGTNFISVADGGVLTVKSIQVGAYTAGGSTGNYVYIGEDGTLNVSNTFRLGSYESDWSPRGNSLIISNGTYRGSFPTFGSKKGASNMVVRVVGRKSVFDAGVRPGKADLAIFAYEMNNRLEFDDAVWTNNVATAVCLNYSQATKGGCVFELKNDAEFHTTNTFNMTGTDYACRSNLVSVLSGSRFYAGGNVGTWSKGNVFSVSNGTFEVGKDLSVSSTGGNVQSQGGISNNWFKIAGDSSCVIVTNGTFTVNRASFLSYDLPETGYVANLVPVKAKRFTVSDVHSRVYVNGLEARQNQLRHECQAKEVVTLAESADDISFNATALAASQALLPKGCSLAVSDDKKKLQLTIKSGLGMFLLVR